MTKPLLKDIQYHPLKARHITLETCQKYNYGIAKDHHGNHLHVASYVDKFGKVIAQKCRTIDKKFMWYGDTKHVQDAGTLFGRHLFKPGNKRIIITEGEIDALTCFQVLGSKWPVVSLINGAASAKTTITKNLDYLESFDEIVICFDQDDAGRKATQDVIELFQPGKAKIVTLPLKDPNEMLVQGRIEDLKTALWGAEEHTPQGFVDASNLLDDLVDYSITKNASYPFPLLDETTYGLRKGELVTVTAGTGTGKSTFCQYIAHHLLQNNNCENIGYLALEESIKKTALSILSFSKGSPLHMSKDPLKKEDLKGHFDKLFSKGRLHLYDHFGSCKSDDLLNKIRYLVKAKNCGWIFLDHISMVLSGDSDGDERRKIDALMTKLRCLVEELGCGMVVVSHLRRKNSASHGKNSENKTHEEGGHISLSDLRGSQSIAQISDIVIALTRDQQEQSEYLRNSIRLHVLKNRFTGETGSCDTIKFNRDMMMFSC